jgi:hypothetical protein
VFTLSQIQYFGVIGITGNYLIGTVIALNSYTFSLGDIPKEHRSKVDSIFTLIVAKADMVKGNMEKVLYFVLLFPAETVHRSFPFVVIVLNLSNMVSFCTIER